MEISDSDDSDNENAKSKSSSKMKLKAKEAELDRLFAMPITTVEFSGKYPTKTGKLQLPKEFEGKDMKFYLP